MKEQEILALRVKVQSFIQAAATAVNEMAVELGPQPNIGSMCAYEASRRLEEAMHRVNDLAAVMVQRSDENVDKLVAEAAANGGLKVIPAAPPEGKQ